jgi:hypothetical protein
LSAILAGRADRELDDHLKTFRIESIITHTAKMPTDTKKTSRAIWAKVILGSPQ